MKTINWFRSGSISPLALLIVLLCFVAAGYSQTPGKAAVSADSEAVRSSPAYAEVLLRKTELQSDLEAYLADYTEENPKIKDIRFEIGALDRSLEKVFSVKSGEAGKLTQALGKLIVKKASLETDLSRLRRNYSIDHPDVKRAAKRVEIFDSAIREVLK